MQHPIHAGGGFGAGIHVANIAFDKFSGRGDPFALSIDKAVQHPDRVTARQQALAKMAADKARAAGDQDFLHGAFLYRLWKKVRSSFVLMPRASVASATSTGVTVQPCADRKGRKGRKLISPVPAPCGVFAR